MELTFDKMPVDTSLAQAYLKNNNQDSDSLFYDGIKYYPEIIELFDYTPIEYSCKQLKTLSEKIKENIDLLAQLEYELRGIPIEDSKQQINVIIQQLHYVLSVHLPENKLKSDIISKVYINMTKDAPLLLLGYIGKAVMEAGAYFMIRAEKATSAICVLFTKLCYEAGLPVGTSFEENLSDPLRTEDLPSLVGAVGVICEHSDIDSAIDMLLESSAKAPWRLQRILVQESISDQFKKVLAWKGKLDGSFTPECLIYRGRKFHFDQLGSTEPDVTEVYIDTYRTTKELLSILSQYPSYYLSLWANNITEINEITYSVRTPIVWVNNFADFRGPARISEAIYPSILIASAQTYEKSKNLTLLSKLRSSWLKLTYEARRDIVCGVLAACDTSDSHRIANSLMYGFNNSFVHINKDFVCSVVPDVSDNVIYYIVYYVEETLKSLAFFESVIMGAAYAIDTQVAGEESIKLIDKFTNANVPIVGYTDTDVKDKNGLTLYWNQSEFYVSRRSRLIVTNSGTTFAN